MFDLRELTINYPENFSYILSYLISHLLDDIIENNFDTLIKNTPMSSTYKLKKIIENGLLHDHEHKAVGNLVHNTKIGQTIFGFGIIKLQNFNKIHDLKRLSSFYRMHLSFFTYFHRRSLVF